MGDIASWIWVLIPLAGIGGWIFTEWTEAQSKRRELGSPNAELEGEVARLKEELEGQQQVLERRIANLETIVTSQTWDVLQDSEKSADDKRFLTSVRDLKSDLSDDRKAEELARRLK